MAKIIGLPSRRVKWGPGRVVRKIPRISKRVMGRQEEEEREEEDMPPASIANCLIQAIWALMLFNSFLLIILNVGAYVLHVVNWNVTLNTLNRLHGNSIDLHFFRQLAMMIIPLEVCTIFSSMLFGLWILKKTFHRILRSPSRSTYSMVKFYIAAVICSSANRVFFACHDYIIGKILGFGNISVFLDENNNDSAYPRPLPLPN